jgi:RNA polymerase sigma factor (sigma-70 family)
MSTISEHERWFRDEVQIHDGALRAWLRGKFPSVFDVDDLVQETLTRVWGMQRAQEITSPRALLFTTAHNLAIDQIRRQKVVQMESLAEPAELFVQEDSPTPSEITAKNQELELLTQALQLLPEKCRQVVTLRKIYGLSQKEIAERLGISEHTVEAQVGNGIRRCAAYFARLGLP